MPWTDISQAAFTLGVSERTIRNWIKNGKMNSRSVNGRREVEIPDPEDEPAAHAFADDDENDEAPGVATQKRLEVALIECGRVKGTLASQERVMENLSANIQELNAKLQKANDHIWKRTLLAVGAAFLGILAWVITEKVAVADQDRLKLNHATQLSTEGAAYRKEREKLRDKSATTLREHEAKQRIALEQLRALGEKTKTDALAALDAKLKREHTAELDKRVGNMQERINKLRENLDGERGLRIRADAEIAKLKEQLDVAQKKIVDFEEAAKKNEE